MDSHASQSETPDGAASSDMVHVLTDCLAISPLLDVSSSSSSMCPAFFEDARVSLFIGGWRKMRFPVESSNSDDFWISA